MDQKLEMRTKILYKDVNYSDVYWKEEKQSKCFNFKGMVTLWKSLESCKKDVFGEFLTWESAHKIKLSMRKKQDIEL